MNPDLQIREPRCATAFGSTRKDIIFLPGLSFG